RPAHNISHVQKIQTILEQEETKVNIDDLLPQGNEKATVRTQIFEAAIVFVGMAGVKLTASNMNSVMSNVEF